MITVYELERKIPKYYGLCGLETERAVYVRHWSPFDYDEHPSWLEDLKLVGFMCVNKRDFPTKLKTGGFTRVLKD